MNRVFPSHVYFSRSLTVLAFVIVKDMNFHPRYDKQQMTPQKLKGSETSPVVKRIRLVSPSPVKKSSTKSDDRLIPLKTLNHLSDVVDDAVSPLSYCLVNRDTGHQSFFI